MATDEPRVARGPRQAGTRRVWPVALAAVALLCLTARGSSEEVRALWVLRTSLTSPATIARMVRTARASGFNTLLVQVRGRGDAYYDGGIEPRAAILSSQPATFDPLEETLSAARELGLRVHAWVNVNLISSAADLPADRRHVIYRHPEWLMVPRPLAGDLSSVAPGSPGYVGKLARWTRASPEQFEGLYLSPLQPAAVKHTLAVVGEIVTRYPVDGVHLDYVRFPSNEFDYSAGALAEFREDVIPDLSTADRQRLDRRAHDDPFVYTDMFPQRWARFRRSRLTTLVMQLRTTVKKARPNAMLSAAVVPDEAESERNRLQDWRTWAENGILDVICPMIYTEDAGAFVADIQSVRARTGAVPVWAGIGAYRLQPSQTIENILAARRHGAQGIVLFSYDSLTGPDQARPNYLREVSQAAFIDPVSPLPALR
jgi:uncharacterized lipoprotein YddW (UPF0748 family)